MQEPTRFLTPAVKQWLREISAACMFELPNIILAPFSAPFEIKISLPDTTHWLPPHPASRERCQEVAYFITLDTSAASLGLERDVVGVETFNINVRETNSASKHAAVFLCFTLGE